MAIVIILLGIIYCGIDWLTGKRIRKKDRIKSEEKSTPNNLPNAVSRPGTRLHIGFEKQKKKETITDFKEFKDIPWDYVEKKDVTLSK